MLKAIITDVEGTTTDIHFVHRELFPYSRDKMRNFLIQHYQQPEIASILQSVAQSMNRASLSIEEISAQLIAWIDVDQKEGSLKKLQGYIWQEGFERGDFKGHVYQDAYHNMKVWQQHGILLYVYSSGSVHAQQLLFQYSIFGDIRYLFKGYFDTHIGAKKEAQSYHALLQVIQITPVQVLFLSDVPAELDAARENQMHTCLLDRANQNVNPNGHPCVRSFDEVSLKFFTEKGRA